MLSYYSRRGDIFFNNSHDCLAFNENLGKFTSFYSYESGKQLVNLRGKGLWFIPST